MSDILHVERLSLPLTVFWSFRWCSAASLPLISCVITFSQRSRVCLTAVQHSDAPLSFPENCHSVRHILATVRDVQFGFVSIYIIAGSYPVLPLNTSLCYFCPQILRGANSSRDWPNLTALLPGNSGPNRLHNSPSQAISLYFFFSLVLLSVNTSTLTGVAISISLIEE